MGHLPVRLSDVFEYLSDEENMAGFLDLLEEAVFDEWDVPGFRGAFEAGLWDIEFAIAAKSALAWAKYYEENGWPVIDFDPPLR